MINEIALLLMPFCQCFSRKAAYNWFVMVVFGLIVRLDQRGVTSFVRSLALSPKHYDNMLHFFRSTSWNLSNIQECWMKIVHKTAPVLEMNGLVLMAGDCTKEPKEANKMPGVKKMHQDSENSAKPTFIFGHNFGVLGLLAGTTDKKFCIPILAEIHEGVEELRAFQGKEAPVVQGEKDTTIVTLMLQSAITVTKITDMAHMLIVDAYYAVGKTFVMAKSCVDETGKQLLHVITRAKGNVVAYIGPEPETNSTIKKRGRKPIWGTKIKLKEQFHLRSNDFTETRITIYGKEETISYLCLDLIWKEINQRIRFVLVKDGPSMFILMCSSLEWSPVDIILAYSYRFKIELTFKALKQLLGSFCYHFWTAVMPRLSKKVPVNLGLITDPETKQRIAAVANAIEGFVNFACIALGCLQIIALAGPQKVWNQYTGWLRTKRTHVPSEEIVRSVVQESFYHNFGDFSNCLIFRILMAKRRRTQYWYRDHAA